MIRVSAERPGDVRFHSPITHLPVGAVTWRTSLSPVRLQVSSRARRLRSQWWWREFGSVSVHCHFLAVLLIDASVEFSWKLRSIDVVPNLSHCQITRSTRFPRHVGIIKLNPNPTTNLNHNHNRNLRNKYKINEHCARDFARSRTHNGTDASFFGTARYLANPAAKWPSTGGVWCQ